MSKAVSPVSRPCDPLRREQASHAEVIVSYNGNHRDLLNLAHLTWTGALYPVQFKKGTTSALPCAPVLRWSFAGLYKLLA